MQIDKVASLLASELSKNDLCVFVGAGASIAAGMPSWKDLLNPVAHELGLDVEREHDLVTLAQFYVNQCGSRMRLYEHLSAQLSKSPQPSMIHTLLSELPFYSYWTTNYDRLLETTLADAHKNPLVIIFQNQFSTNKQDSKAKIFKMHGDIDHPDSIVISRDDYESYSLRKGIFLDFLKTELLSKTFIFVGFSLVDPNFRYVLGQLKSVLGDFTRTHYWLELIPKVGETESPDLYQYRRQRLGHHIKDLDRLNIKCVPVDGFDELTGFFEKITKQFKSIKLKELISEHAYAVLGAFNKTDDVEGGLVPIAAPFSGTYFSSRSSGAVSLIGIGDFVEKDQEICIINVGQVPHLIRSPVAGFVQAIIARHNIKVHVGEILLTLSLSAGPSKGKMYYQNFHISGTFYRADDPGGEPFVREGQVVKKGDVLAIIERMKMYFYVKADVSGVILTIVKENGQAIESLSTLFIIKTQDKNALYLENDKIKIYKSSHRGIFSGIYLKDSRKRHFLDLFYGQPIRSGKKIGEILVDSDKVFERNDSDESISVTCQTACIFLQYLTGFDALVEKDSPIFSYIPISGVADSFSIKIAPIGGVITLEVGLNSKIKPDEVIGSIKTDDGLLVELFSDHDGFVVETLVTSGQKVAEGQILFKIKRGDY